MSASLYTVPIRINKANIGSMRRLYAHIVCIVMIALPSASARAAEFLDIQISRADDLLMSCHEISREIALMETIVHQTRLTQERAELTSAGVGVAKTVASYLVGSLGGAIGIMAASYIVNEATDDRGDNAKTIEDLAQQRRSFMKGVFNARACMGPLELSSIEPAAGIASIPERQEREVRYHYND